ncbi:MAG: PD40 domain-containing protein [Candidatus Omnitrophica bacterium]|nr:PD40 domain-containing protein [Candidatus Omnitrophota bacterium]
MDLKGKIVLSSGKTGDYDIWTLDLSSKILKQLTTGMYWNDCPKWSPDGKRILFVSNRTGTPEIWVMNEDGSDEIRITKTEKWHNTPDWSPDGQRIVFCANYDGNLDIYTMDLNGADRKQITNYEGVDSTPQYSPDGQKIIFTSQRSGNDDIWTYHLLSGKVTQLTTYKHRDYSPTYSPDNSLIALVCGESAVEEGENLEIYFMDKEGKNRRRITRNLGTDRYVAWSPDGKFLVYTSSRANSTAERLMVTNIEKMKLANIDFDRGPLETEIDAEPQAVGIFCFLPESIVRKTYPQSYFGTERYPDWKF